MPEDNVPAFTIGDFIAAIQPLSHNIRNDDTKKMLDDLPRLTEAQLEKMGHRDSVCPICFNTFLAILSEEEMALAMDSPAHPPEELGITKLSQEWQCGHIFCRRDISKWIVQGNDSCPTCRRPFAKLGNNPPPNQTRDSAPDLQDLMDNIDPQSFEDFMSRVGIHPTATSNPPFTTTRRDDRNDFTGMYS